MFFVPDEGSLAKPGWRQNRFFVGSASEPILFAHVIPESVQGEAGLWGFSDPADLETLVNGISLSAKSYRLASLMIVIPPAMRGHSTQSSEVVLRVVTSSGPRERKTYIARTVNGNDYILGDMPTARTVLDNTIYNVPDQ